MAQPCTVDWGPFICDIAQSCGCVFSTSSLVDPPVSRMQCNQEVDVDPKIESPPDRG